MSSLDQLLFERVSNPLKKPPINSEAALSGQRRDSGEFAKCAIASIYAHLHMPRPTILFFPSPHSAWTQFLESKLSPLPLVFWHLLVEKLTQSLTGLMTIAFCGAMLIFPLMAILMIPFIPKIIAQAIALVSAPSDIITSHRT